MSYAVIFPFAWVLRVIDALSVLIHHNMSGGFPFKTISANNMRSSFWWFFTISPESNQAVFLKKPLYSLHPIFFWADKVWDFFWMKIQDVGDTISKASLFPP
jgi:hypothetical protein